MQTTRVAGALRTRTLQMRFDTPAALRAEFERNISNRGIFVATEAEFEIRQSVEVEIVLVYAMAPADPVVLRGEIVHRLAPEMARSGGRAGVAVQFEESVAELRARFEPLLGDEPLSDPDADQAGARRRSARRTAVRVPVRVRKAKGASVHGDDSGSERDGSPALDPGRAARALRNRAGRASASVRRAEHRARGPRRARGQEQTRAGRGGGRCLRSPSGGTARGLRGARCTARGESSGAPRRDQRLHRGSRAPEHAADVRQLGAGRHARRRAGRRAGLDRLRRQPISRCRARRTERQARDPGDARLDRRPLRVRGSGRSGAARESGPRVARRRRARGGLRPGRAGATGPSRRIALRCDLARRDLSRRRSRKNRSRMPRSTRSSRRSSISPDRG